MKALFVSGTLGYGGAEGHSITLVNRLAERGHECHVVYIKAAQDHYVPRLAGAASVHGLEVRGYLEASAVREFAARLARLSPGVVVAANPYAAVYARLALQRAGLPTPLAITFHTTVPRDLKEWTQMLLYRPLFWSADCLVFVCEAQARYWRRRGLAGRRNEMIYNGVDLEHWRPAGAAQRAAMRGTLGLAEDDYVVALCGRFRPEKNHVQLVDAIAALRARGIPARALLIGDGPTRPAIEARAHAAGVSPHVVIAGLQKDVRPMLGAADVAVLCSVAVETFSIAALEAMALERPMVLSDIGGAAEMVRPGHNGFLFPARDTEAFVAHLAHLAEPEARRRMGAAARATVETLFSEEAMVERYEHLLSELELSRRQRGILRTSATAHQK